MFLSEYLKHHFCELQIDGVIYSYFFLKYACLAIY